MNITKLKQFIWLGGGAIIFVVAVYVMVFGAQSIEQATMLVHALLGLLLVIEFAVNSNQPTDGPQGPTGAY